MSKDYLIRMMLPELNLCAYAVDTLDTAREICTAHNTTPNASSALGQSISAAALLTSSLQMDSDQSLSYKIQGSGPLMEIHVQADAKGNIRGYVKRPRIDEETDLGKINFSKAIGAGLLTVTKDLGMKEPYTGVTHLVKGELATDTAYYLTSSEQRPSAVILALNFGPDLEITASGGILIQTFPDTPEKSIALIESKLAAPHRSLGDALIAREPLSDYLSALLDNTAVEVTHRSPLAHHCSCSRELIKSILRSIDTAELADMREKDKGAHVECKFCNKSYHFSEDEITEAINAQTVSEKSKLDS
jgi:molecular chaperone Hsp33